MLFSSLEAGEKVSMSLAEVGSLSKVRKSLMSDCTWTRCGPVTVLQIKTFLPLFCCQCAQVGALPWAPSASCSSSWCWGAQGRTELFSCRGWGGCQDLRKNCALVAIGEHEIPGYVLYSWFALKWLLKLLSATRFSKISEEHLTGWSYCTETLLFPTSAVFDLPFLVLFCT